MRVRSFGHHFHREALRRAAGAVERGDLTARVDIRQHDEIGVLTHSANALLQANLANAGPVDAELQELLVQLDGDIQALLERGKEEQPDGGTTTYGLAERSQEISAKFAAEHPKLEPALRELGRMLSNIGV